MIHSFWNRLRLNLRALKLRDWFAAELDRTEAGWEHHYILFLARKRKTP